MKNTVHIRVLFFEAHCVVDHDHSPLSIDTVGYVNFLT